MTLDLGPSDRPLLLQLLSLHGVVAARQLQRRPRLAGDFRQTWGQGLEKADCRAILDRAFPGDG